MQELISRLQGPLSGISSICALQNFLKNTACGSWGEKNLINISEHLGARTWKNFTPLFPKETSLQKLCLASSLGRASSKISLGWNFHSSPLSLVVSSVLPSTCFKTTTIIIIILESLLHDALFFSLVALGMRRVAIFHTLPIFCVLCHSFTFAYIFSLQHKIVFSTC